MKLYGIIQLKHVAKGKKAQEKAAWNKNQNQTLKKIYIFFYFILVINWILIQETIINVLINSGKTPSAFSINLIILKVH